MGSQTSLDALLLSVGVAPDRGCGRHRSYACPPMSPSATDRCDRTGYVGPRDRRRLRGAGARVHGVDIDADKVARLRRGEVPIYEPGLERGCWRAIASV